MTEHTSESHHLYFHVPFCRLVCAYCDFVTFAGRRADLPRYADGMLAELAARPAPGRLETIYFGGGTPSLLAPADVARLVDTARRRWGTAPLEVSLEVNPGRRERPDFGALRAAGVTRVSLGVQSLRDDELRTLARGHSGEEALECVAEARAARFASVSIDLIYAIPGQSLPDWRAGLDAAVALGPDHLSLYALSLPLVPDEWAAPPRPGALRWRRRMAARQDDDLAADQYELAEALLAEAGYRHYELSSWARPGHECRHNAAYWRRAPYTGIGAGAHSFDGASRSWNIRSIDAYLSAVELGRSPREASEHIDAEIAELETVALGLRAVDGLSRERFSARFGIDPLDRFPDAIAAGAGHGLVEVDAHAVRLTRRGRLLANEALLPFAAEAAPAG